MIGRIGIVCLLLVSCSFVNDASARQRRQPVRNAWRAMTGQSQSACAPGCNGANCQQQCGPQCSGSSCPVNRRTALPTISRPIAEANVAVPNKDVQEFHRAEYCNATFEDMRGEIFVVYWLSSETNEFGKHKIVMVANYSPKDIDFVGDTITAKRPVVAEGKQSHDVQHSASAVRLPYDIFVRDNGRQEIKPRPMNAETSSENG